MKCCRFCHEEILDKSFQIIEPDGATSFFCKDCGDGLIDYVVSGRAEKDVEARINQCKSIRNNLEEDVISLMTAQIPTKGIGVNVKQLMAMLNNSSSVLKSSWSNKLTIDNDDNGPPF